MKQYRNSSSEMETGDHSKNGASLKSQMSRRNFITNKKIKKLIILSGVLCGIFFIHNLCAQNTWQSKYDDVKNCFNDTYVVKSDNMYGIVNKNGEAITSIKYYNIYCFRDGWARVNYGGRWGFVDEKGKEMNNTYDWCNDFYDGVAWVIGDNGAGLVNNKGKEVAPCKYDLDIITNQPFFYDGLAKVKLDEKWGFINKDGEEIVPCKYDDVSNFSEGMASVMKDFKVGFVDIQGNEIVPCEYDYFSFNTSFHNGIVKVYLDGKAIIIDTKGQIADETLTFKNYNESENFSVEYPADWRIDRISAYPAICFLSPYESDFDTFAENFNIVEGYHQNNDTYNTYIEGVKLSGSRLSLINFEITKTEILNSDFGECFRVIYKGQETYAESSTLRFEAYLWLLKNNRSIAITFTCREFSCDDYKETFDKILKSFKINSL